MKSLLATLVLILILSSCQKEYTADMSNETKGVTGNLKAKINGIQWNADKGAAANFSTAGNGLPRLLNISGLSNDKKFLTITLTDSGVHKYTLSDNSKGFAAFVDSSLTNAAPFSTNQGFTPGITGTVEITAINTTQKTISGTFSFKVYRIMDSTERDITEGSFTDLSYNDGAIIPPSSSTDTFRVKVNDTTFTPYSITASFLSFNNTIMIQGFDSLAVKGVAFIVPSNVAAGSYDLSNFTDYMGTYSNGAAVLGSNSGTLQILEHNTTTKRIRGNFNFTATHILDPTISAAITGGYFSVEY